VIHHIFKSGKYFLL